MVKTKGEMPKGKNTIFERCTKEQKRQDEHATEEEPLLCSRN